MDKRIKVIETVLTDANDRVLGNKMTTEEMVPILGKMDEVGFYAIECWGRRTFMAAFDNLDDPWERLGEIRKRVKNTKLMITMQGRRIFSDEMYPDEMISSFIEVAVDRGISIFRLYDRANEMANLETAVNAVHENGAAAHVELIFREGETAEHLAELAKEAEELHADAIIVDDPAGTLQPYKAGRIFAALKEAVNIPLGISMRHTRGCADMCYLKALENGAEIIHTTCASLFACVSMPATDVITEIFEGTDRAAGLNRSAIIEVNEYFREISEKYQKSKVFSPDKMGLDFNVKSAPKWEDPHAMVYDAITEEDVHRIRHEIALVEKDPMDAVTYALYPEETKEYLSKRARQ